MKASRLCHDPDAQRHLHRVEVVRRHCAVKSQLECKETGKGKCSQVQKINKNTMPYKLRIKVPRWKAVQGTLVSPVLVSYTRCCFLSL